jgi:hypothetical protein
VFVCTRMNAAIDKCKLCLRPRKLLKSHFLPAALWAGTREPRLVNTNPVVMTKRISITTSRQMRTRLLCKSCEQLFNKNGERYVLSWLAPKGIIYGGFPLLERLRIAVAPVSSPAFRAYSSASIGIDTERFAYFGLSILWRAAVHRWRLPDGSLREQIPLADYEEPIRKYLLSEAHFPDDIAIILTVCADSESRGHFLSSNSAT